MPRKRNALARHAERNQRADCLLAGDIGTDSTTAERAQHLHDRHGLSFTRAALIARLHFGEVPDAL